MEKQNVDTRTACPVCHGATKEVDNMSYVGGGAVHLCIDTACSASAPTLNCLA